MRLSKSGVIAAVIGAAVLAGTVISPAIGGPSLKKLVRNEVSKQLAKKPALAGPAGPAGPQGAPGADFTANSVLRSGETLTGVWVVVGGTGGNAAAAIQFAPQLPTALGPGAVHRLAPATTSAACPGPGQANAGNLCVYEVTGGSGSSFNFIGDPGTNNSGANRRGAVIWYTTSTASGNANGTWAVTAP
jgi:hypothetical protein